jgi:nucleotide-binding universal stress UspA family protein
MSGAERLVFGSTTEGVLRRTTSSVLVTPSEWHSAQPWLADLTGTGPVVAAVDFTPESAGGAKAACRLASMLNTTVEMIHVIPEPPVLARWRGHTTAAVRDQVEAARTKLAKLATSSDVMVPCRSAQNRVKCRVGSLSVPHRRTHAGRSSCWADERQEKKAWPPVLLLIEC